jgi:tight adherence protein C
MNPTYLIITALVMGSVLALTIGLRAARNRKSAVLATAMNNAALAPASLRELEMAKSSTDRILMPLARRFTLLGRMLTPSKNLQQLQSDLVRAGLITKISVADFMGIRVIGGIGAATLTYFFFAIQQPLLAAISFSLSGFAVGLYLPNIWLKSRIGQRQKAIQRNLPDALDMMSICVDAGLGFEAAIQKVAFQWDNELAHELRQVIRELRVGLTRSDALRNLVERTGVDDVGSFVGVLIQADRLGIAIKDVLHTQAVQMRIRRRQRAEESAAKAPLKMMFPMVFFIFPAMFAVILGPAVPRVMSML